MKAPRDPFRPSYAPSLFHRWSECPGSVALVAEKGARSESQAASWGTRTHEIAERVLTKQKLTDGDWDFLRDHPDLEQAVNEYVAFVRSQHSRFPGGELRIEQEVPMTFSGSRGFIDALIMTPTRWVLIDLKTGRFPVSPDSPQLKIYASELLTQTHPQVRPDWVEVAIFQPSQAQRHRRKAFSAAFLIEWRETRLLPAYGAASAEEPPRKAGETQCRWCPVKNECPEHQEWKRRGTELTLKNGDARLQGLLFRMVNESHLRSVKGAPAGSPTH